MSTEYYHFQMNDIVPTNTSLIHDVHAKLYSVGKWVRADVKSIHSVAVGSLSTSEALIGPCEVRRTTWGNRGDAAISGD